MSIEESHRELMNEIVLTSQDEGNFEEAVFFEIRR